MQASSSSPAIIQTDLVARVLSSNYLNFKYQENRLNIDNNRHCYKT